MSTIKTQAELIALYTSSITTKVDNANKALAPLMEQGAVLGQTVLPMNETVGVVAANGGFSYESESAEVLGATGSLKVSSIATNLRIAFSNYKNSGRGVVLAVYAAIKAYHDDARRNPQVLRELLSEIDAANIPVLKKAIIALINGLTVCISTGSKEKGWVRIPESFKNLDKAAKADMLESKKAYFAVFEADVLSEECTSLRDYNVEEAYLKSLGHDVGNTAKEEKESKKKLVSAAKKLVKSSAALKDMGLPELEKYVDTVKDYDKRTGGEVKELSTACMDAAVIIDMKKELAAAMAAMGMLYQAATGQAYDADSETSLTEEVVEIANTYEFNIPTTSTNPDKDAVESDEAMEAQQQ